MVLLDVASATAKVEMVVSSLLNQGVQLGITILKALVVFWVGRLLIKLVNKLLMSVMDKRNFDPSVKSFVGSLVNVSLMILLIISIVGVFGVETTSFAALLASAGVAIGMALSGNMSNFAGGLMILVFKPYKVGDYIAAQGVEGSVEAIQMFNTVLLTPDNKVIFVPNGALSSGTITNFSAKEKRRVDWAYTVAYGCDYELLKKVATDVMKKDSRILNDPAAPFVSVNTLEGGVNVTVRGWVKSGDYWDVYFDVNNAIYAAFSQEGIKFLDPHLTVHQA